MCFPNSYCFATWHVLDKHIDIRVRVNYNFFVIKYANPCMSCRFFSYLCVHDTSLHMKRIRMLGVRCVNGSSGVSSLRGM